MIGGKFYDGHKIVLPLEKNATMQLLNHWIQQAVSGFMAAFASKRIKNLDSRNVERFHSCSKEAISVTKHAKCIVDLLTLGNTILKQTRTAKSGNTKYQFLRNKNKIPKLNASGEQNRQYASKVGHWIGSFHVLRRKRSSGKTKQKIKTVNKNTYHLLTDKDTNTALGMIIKGMKKTLQRLKHKKESKSWSMTMAEVQHIAMQMKERGELSDMLKNRITNNTSSSKYPIEMLIDSKKRISRDNGMQLAASLSKLFRDGAVLALAMSNQTVSNLHNKTIRIVSPRFFSILPDVNAQNTMNILSPSILSLHDEGGIMERKLSMSRILEAFKLMNGQDQNELLGLISEASGLSDTVQQIHEELEMTDDNKYHVKGIDGQPLYFTRQNVSELYGEVEGEKVDTFEKLYKALSKQQIAEMNATGYAVLNKKQLEVIYGQRSPYYHPNALRRLLKLLDQSDGLQKSLENDFKKLAKSENFGLHARKLHRRQKRFGISLSPFLLSPFMLASRALSQPIVLSPVVLSPVVLSPAILGPFILSPWVFNPVILSPRILAPFILNPFIFSPIVLSPVVLHPFILSPGIFNPLVLSPLALSPLILSPQVATPLILSPMILNPLLLNPMALSPLVFSPFILSPLVYSPQYLFALVFSPHMLSPQIESQLISSTVIMSPSILS
uniref:Uncharacterized protein n=1 Tax=Setaria digitata TaxID=48799 RepID=A0A915PPR2_9BILA